MEIMRKTAILLFTLLFTLLFSMAAFAGEDVKPAGKLTKVEPKTVCMINEHAMGKDQIPVEVDGKTYYGCCDMCKKALATDASKRNAVDPVSGKLVDKATAVIAAQEDGRVFYFESDETLEKYNKSVK
jgi:YHS domain-containing protein